MSVQPLGGWDYDGHPDIVWASRLDDRYLVEVVRTSERLARLRLFDNKESPIVLLDESVPLSYGALFGPDVDDVARWQERVMEVVDGGGAR
jgi:hypothetical protein